MNSKTIRLPFFFTHIPPSYRSWATLSTFLNVHKLFLYKDMLEKLPPIVSLPQYLSREGHKSWHWDQNKEIHSVSRFMLMNPRFLPFEEGQGVSCEPLHRKITSYYTRVKIFLCIYHKLIIHSASSYVYFICYILLVKILVVLIMQWRGFLLNQSLCLNTLSNKLMSY